MSKKKTPCEKLGYKVGDKFTVIKDSYFEKGTIVALSEDDGSEVPWFTCGGVRRSLIIGSNPDVEPTPSKLKPAKQALADAIHQNGGWGVERFMYATSNYVGMVKMFVNKPKLENANWNADGTQIVFAWLSRPLPNWHQCVLSREEYYHAYPKADADGWIEWKGGECPVDNDSLVDVKFPDGSEYFNTDAYWDWSSESDTPISHYRQSKKVVKPWICESVTSSIPEPEAKPTIEQLAADYRNAKDYADRKQDEADKASMESDAALSQLEDAIAAIGFVITPLAATVKEPELVAAVKVGDQVGCVESNIKRAKYNGMVGRLHFIDESDTSTPYLVDFGGEAKIWCHEVKFIRRP